MRQVGKSASLRIAVLIAATVTCLCRRAVGEQFTQKATLPALR
jgi:hypothetical protein